MKKSTITVNMMMEMCMASCVPFSDAISTSEADHCAA